MRCQSYTKQGKKCRNTAKKDDCVCAIHTLGEWEDFGEWEIYEDNYGMLDIIEEEKSLDVWGKYEDVFEDAIEFEDSDVEEIHITVESNTESDLTVSEDEDDKMCIPKSNFNKLVREILSEICGYEIEQEAIDALQEVSEEHLINLFNNAGACATNVGRKTITVEDFKLVSAIQK
jgi:histone H3/H4